MIVILTTFFGGYWGTRTAKRRHGNRKDILQFSAVYAIIGALIGLLLTLGIDNYLS